MGRVRVSMNGRARQAATRRLRVRVPQGARIWGLPCGGGLRGRGGARVVPSRRERPSSRVAARSWPTSARTPTRSHGPATRKPAGQAIASMRRRGRKGGALPTASASAAAAQIASGRIARP